MKVKRTASGKLFIINLPLIKHVDLANPNILGSIIGMSNFNSMLQWKSKK